VAATLIGAAGRGARGQAAKLISIRNESIQNPPQKRPNVLLLMSDQHKRSCLGISGDRVAKTPNLDALGSGSVRFSNAYCTNPVCTPSRASIMTGLFSHHLEAQNNAQPFRPEHLTMAHHFNRAGYMTALIGKMHFVDAQSHGFEYRLDFNDWLQ
jgi:choline-sulfatase